MVMDYEGFKKEIFKLTGIDLGSYKEKQMKRRLDSLISKNNFSGYKTYIEALKTDKKLFNEFINYMTINVSGWPVIAVLQRSHWIYRRK